MIEIQTLAESVLEAAHNVVVLKEDFRQAYTTMRELAQASLAAAWL